MRQRGKLAAFARGYGAPRKTEVKRQMSEDGERIDLNPKSQELVPWNGRCTCVRKICVPNAPARSSY